MHRNLAKPRLNLLSDSQKQQIHDAVTLLLGTTGIRVEDQEAIRIFADAGAVVDGDRVRLPAAVVSKALAQAPRQVMIYDRDGREAMRLGTDTVYFGTHSDTPDMYDTTRGQLRPFRLDDVGQLARLCDALENIDFIAMSGFAEEISDPTLTPALAMARMMRNSSKPLGLGANDVAATQLMLDVACTVREGKADLAARPFFYYYSEPTTPLTHTSMALRRFLLAVEYGIPVVYTPMVMAGATGPATLAGTVVQALADALPGIVLAQTVRPGAPCITGGIPTIMDMSTTICSYGAPELSLMGAALTEMAGFYGLPMFGTGGCSDAPALDGQLASEATFSCLAAALSGAHLIHDVGLFYHALRVSAEAFVLCDEIVAMVRSFLQGMGMDAEALATEVITAVGPGGHFLSEDHTLANFRRVWHPTLFDRSMQGGPESSEALTRRLHGRAQQLLATHQPRPLSPEADRKLGDLEQELMARA
jgi:trimethylamine---corrinoid protein Co-methyltransferase